MPYVNIKITREGGTTKDQKRQLIRGVTELLQQVLHKSPATTHVTIEEIETCDWGLGGESVEELRKRESSASGS